MLSISHPFCIYRVKAYRTVYIQKPAYTGGFPYVRIPLQSQYGVKQPSLLAILTLLVFYIFAQYTRKAKYYADHLAFFIAIFVGGFPFEILNNSGY